MLEIAVVVIALILFFKHLDIVLALVVLALCLAVVGGVLFVVVAAVWGLVGGLMW